MQPGAVISEAWDLYKTHWQHLLPIALVVYVVLGLDLAAAGVRCSAGSARSSAR